ncbi:MAG TPA: hypothetical protein VMX54_00165 [Vicinamibacteria bacterium]|nr:hypothetical protein [Vicinamibacteria bacterium]
MTRLAELPVLVLDAQATAADPAGGALLEIGWARWSAGTAGELAGASVTAQVVAAPPGGAVPRPVSRVTGLGTAEWVRGVPPATVWERLLAAARRVARVPVPSVVHYARFEQPFLRRLHALHGSGPFPLELVCTHAIARRLLPELPRRTLRALAGYFGAGVPSLRRSADHVRATALVWRELVTLLADSEGICDLEALRDWLAGPAPRAARRFPLARERRLSLPDRPGVYRLLRAGGAVLYVGKAASLRHRVSGHFHARPAGERALELLTQVRDVSCAETVTALEAALLEADEIKRLAPPFNRALATGGRRVWFASPDLAEVQEDADAAHPVGPLVSRATLEAFTSARLALAAAEAVSLPVRARALGVAPAFAPSPECFEAGLARFARQHGPAATTPGLLRLGSRLWALRRVATVVDDDAAAAPSRPAWDEGRVCQALEETVVRAAHAVRRARWLVRLCECALAWAEPEAATRRLLVIHGGEVAERGDLPPGAPLPVPPGHRRPPAARRAAFDLACFDRLRVLGTELRVVAAAADSVELRLGEHARLSRRRLQAVLRWV